MTVKVFDGDGNEIGLCSDYSVEAKAPSGQNLDDKKVPPPLEVNLTLKDWKTPAPIVVNPEPPPPMEPQERKAANAMIGLLAWMLGGKVEVNMKDVLAVMDDKDVHQIRHPGDPDKIFIEVEDK